MAGPTRQHIKSRNVVVLRQESNGADQHVLETVGEQGSNGTKPYSVPEGGCLCSQSARVHTIVRLYVLQHHQYVLQGRDGDSKMP